MKYSTAHLIKAQQDYNTEYLNNPSKFNEEIDSTQASAQNQIDYLLSLVD